MAANYDSDVDVVAFEHWITQVEKELDEFERDLDEIQKVYESCSGTDDTIYGKLMELGQKMADKYLELKKAYTELVENSKKIIKGLAEAAGKVIETFNKFTKNFKL